MEGIHGGVSCRQVEQSQTAQCVSAICNGALSLPIFCFDFYFYSSRSASLYLSLSFVVCSVAKACCVPRLTRSNSGGVQWRRVDSVVAVQCDVWRRAGASAQVHRRQLLRVSHQRLRPRVAPLQLPALPYRFFTLHPPFSQADIELCSFINPYLVHRNRTLYLDPHCALHRIRLLT